MSHIVPMDQGKDIDLTPNDYRVVTGKRREPFINWENVPALLYWLAGIVVAKVAFLYAIGKLPV